MRTTKGIKMHEWKTTFLFSLPMCTYHSVLRMNIYAAWDNDQLECRICCCFRKGNTEGWSVNYSGVSGGNAGLGQTAGFWVSRADVSCIQEMTETRAILTLPSPAPLFLPFSSLCGHPELKACYYGRSRLPQTRRNWLDFKSFWEYFWNSMGCLCISEPGPRNTTWEIQKEWHFVQGVVAFFF